MFKETSCFKFRAEVNIKNHLKSTPSSPILKDKTNVGKRPCIFEILIKVFCAFLVHHFCASAFRKCSLR